MTTASMTDKKQPQLENGDCPYIVRPLAKVALDTEDASEEQSIKIKITTVLNLLLNLENENKI
jgi:hypothetical protein